MLPDVAILQIFDFYIMNEDQVDAYRIQAWQTLAHVCRNWRMIVFDSLRRLKLRLLCTSKTPIPVRKTLEVWPLLPIVVRNVVPVAWSTDETLKVLEHNDCICQLQLDAGFPSSNSQWENLLKAMQKPFPALEHLTLNPSNGTVAVVPVSLLGGSAPSLKTFSLHNIPFPGLPNLLLSTTHLVYIDLWYIPHSGYISPKAMVTCLSTLTRLETLRIGFKYPQIYPDQNGQRLPPQVRTLLPAVTNFWFQGVSEYLEDLLARVDTPLLKKTCFVLEHLKVAIVNDLSTST